VARKKRGSKKRKCNPFSLEEFWPGGTPRDICVLCKNKRVEDAGYPYPFCKSCSDLLREGKLDQTYGKLGSEKPLLGPLRNSRLRKNPRQPIDQVIKVAREFASGDDYVLWGYIGDIRTLSRIDIVTHKTNYLTETDLKLIAGWEQDDLLLLYYVLRDIYRRRDKVRGEKESEDEIIDEKMLDEIARLRITEFAQLPAKEKPVGWNEMTVDQIRTVLILLEDYFNRSERIMAFRNSYGQKTEAIKHLAFKMWEKSKHRYERLLEKPAEPPVTRCAMCDFDEKRESTMTKCPSCYYYDYCSTCQKCYYCNYSDK
jgi:rubrerythrin